MKVYKLKKDTPFASKDEIVTEDKIKNVDLEYLEEVIHPEEEKNQEYFSVSIGLGSYEIHRNINKNRAGDIKCKEFGNFFLTKEEAESKAQEMLQILRGQNAIKEG